MRVHLRCTQNVIKEAREEIKIIQNEIKDEVRTKLD